MLNNLNHDTKIGIWGFGVTGKSAASFFKKNGFNHLQILDKKELTAQEKTWLQDNSITYLNQQNNREAFFAHNDLLFVTPGINIKPFPQISCKLISELDLFYSVWNTNQPIIAITGSIGKTTVTTLLAKILEKSGLRIALGGNIGVGMLDLTEKQELCDAVVLELSSFQLSQSKTFAPDLAIWTNLYPNHLDWHTDLDEYRHAKAQIFAHQKTNQKVLLPFALKDSVTPQSAAHYFSMEKPADLVTLPTKSTLFYIENGFIVAHTANEIVSIYQVDQLPNITFAENWLIIMAALYLQQIRIPDLANLSLAGFLEHRLEKVASINGVDYYNDSKSTTPQSTLAAVTNLSKRPVLLLLGGLSKGINRKPLIVDLKNKVKKIYCFGKEADQLAQFCADNNIACQIFYNLDDAFIASKEQAHPGDQVLLSPAGSSFDLFTNYVERGNYFKKLVSQ